MVKKDEAWSVMNKAKYELEDKQEKLEAAKDSYREALVEETIEAVLNILNEDGTLTERDLKLTLGDLALRTKQIYIK